MNARQSRRSWADWPLHPLWFALYPPLALLAANISQIRPEAAWRAALVSALAGLGLWALLTGLSKDLRRAALLTSLLLALFFSYGHLYNYLERLPALAGLLGRHRTLLVVWAGLGGLAAWWALQPKRDLRSLTQALNGMGLALLLLSGGQIALYEARSGAAQAVRHELPAELASLRLPDSPPDVYYIILDGYSRQDVLERVMSYDNGPFVGALSELGFYVAPCSQSNYAQTELSLTSALNMDYLDALGAPLDPASADRGPLRPLLRRSRVRQALENLGYRSVAFETGFVFSQLEDVDVYLSGQTGQVGGLNGFELLLLRTSMGIALSDGAVKLPGLLRPDTSGPLRQHYQRTLYALDELERLPAAIPGPKFVFAHIIAPHGPLVFAADGSLALYPEPMDDATYIRAHRDELDYLNRRTLAIVQAILAGSATPPVIIIQGDHAHDLASPADRMDIFNAYYLPGGSNDLPADISPVNSFRLVFNRVFGGQLALLENRSVFSYYETPYQFEAIPPSCP